MWKEQLILWEGDGTTESRGELAPEMNLESEAPLSFGFPRSSV